MRKYTVVLIREEDSACEPQVQHVKAETPDEADEAAQQEGWIVVAVFAGHREAL